MEVFLLHLMATQSLYATIERIGKLCQKGVDCEGDKAGVMPLFGLLFAKMRAAGYERIRMTDVSRQLMITKPAATQAVNKLVEKGLVERVNDENDRRVVYIRPSEGGRRIFEDELEKKLMFIDRAVNRMGEEDANQLVALMDRFLSAVSDELEEN